MQVLIEKKDNKNETGEKKEGETMFNGFIPNGGGSEVTISTREDSQFNIVDKRKKIGGKVMVDVSEENFKFVVPLTKFQEIRVQIEGQGLIAQKIEYGLDDEPISRKYVEL